MLFHGINFHIHFHTLISIDLRMSRKSDLEVNGISTFTVMLLISLEFRHSLIHHIFNGFPWWDAVDE